MKNNLSVIVLTKNSENILHKSLDSVKKIASEIIIIDDYSEDKTIQIAKNFKAKIFRKRLIDFSKQRNFGLKKVQNDWVLFLDSDEIVSKNLAKEIIQKIKIKNKGYLIKRIDIFKNHKMKYGEVGNTRLLRLGRKDGGKWKRSVHEVWEIKGEVGNLKNPIYHYSHNGIKDFLVSVKEFSILHAKANHKEGKRSNILKIIFLPIGKFINSYFFKLGFLDGEAGLVYAFAMSYHSFLAWRELWGIQK